jgi:hypothetical protein
MPYDDPDPSDPNILVGVEIPGSEEVEVDMAYVFAEEFVRLGFSEERLEALFRHPFYAGANRSLLILGEEKIRALIHETVSVWGRFAVSITDAPERKQWDVPLDSLLAGPGQARETESEVPHEPGL